MSEYNSYDDLLNILGGDFEGSEVSGNELSETPSSSKQEAEDIEVNGVSSKIADQDKAQDILTKDKPENSAGSITEFFTDFESVPINEDYIEKIIQGKDLSKKPKETPKSIEKKQNKPVNTKAADDYDELLSDSSFAVHSKSKSANSVKDSQDDYSLDKFGEGKFSVMDNQVQEEVKSEYDDLLGDEFVTVSSGGNVKEESDDDYDFDGFESGAQEKTQKEKSEYDDAFDDFI
ncbi:MAG: hypothetical protein ACOX3U_07755 [Christensenellales bacterium]|jgi:hypothetical protein